MVAILAAVILIPDRDLVRKVIFSGHFHRSPLHLSNVFRLFLIQIQGWLRPRRFKLGVERAALLEPVQLPDAKADAERGPGKDKQSGDQPLTLEHLKQEHFLFSSASSRGYIMRTKSPWGVQHK